MDHIQLHRESPAGSLQWLTELLWKTGYLSRLCGLVVQYAVTYWGESMVKSSQEFSLTFNTPHHFEKSLMDALISVNSLVVVSDSDWYIPLSQFYGPKANHGEAVEWPRMLDSVWCLAFDPWAVILPRLSLSLQQAISWSLVNCCYIPKDDKS